MSLMTKVKNMISVVKNDVYQDGSWKVSFMGSQAPTRIPHLQDYGFASRPAAGKKAVMISRDGNPNAGVIIAIEDKAGAPSLSESEVAIYTSGGAVIHLKSSGNVEISGGDTDITAGNLKIAGTQVVTTQQPLIVPPAGGSVIDVQARAAITSIITTLQTHGLTL